MKSFFTIIFLFFSLSVVSQEIIKNKDYYTAKSRRQKSGAQVMLIGGAGLIGAGLLIGNRESSTFGDAAAGGVLGIAGLGLMIGSIPVFSASAKNKRKAMSIALKNLPLQQLKNSSLVYQPMPAVSIKFTL